jgi:hypothetical protein
MEHHGLDASGPEQLAVIDGKMISQVYQDILQENVRLSVHQQKLGDATGQQPKTH